MTEQVASTRPYFIRAIYEWCTDNGLTPYLAVKVDEHVQVPVEYVEKGKIVLNIAFTATSGLELDNDYIRFQARFAGSARQVIVPVGHVLAIYARENGQGMTFLPSAEDADTTSTVSASERGQSTESESSLSLHVAGEGDDSLAKSNKKEQGKSLDDKSVKKKSTPTKKPILRIVD